MDYVLTLAILQGGLLFVVLLFRQYSDKRTVNLMSVLLLFTVIIMYGRASYQPALLKKYWAFVSLPDALLFLFGPIAYLLTRSLLKLPRLTSVSFWIHFVPAIIHATVFNVILGFIIIDKMPGMGYNELVLGYQLIEGAGIISIAVYLLYSYSLYKTHSHVYAQNYASVEAPDFLIRFFYLQLLLVVLWSLSFGAKLWGVYEWMDYKFYHAFWIAVSFSIYLLTYQLMSKPALLELPTLHPEQIPMVKSEPYLLLDKKGMDDFMHKTNCFMDPDINLDKLSSLLGFNRNATSAIINTEYGVNFFDFINKYRVEAFIDVYAKRIVEEPALTFIEVAYEVGFNSKSAFNRAFKKMMKVTPTAYFSEAASPSTT